MKERVVTGPELALIAGTRAMLGAGIGARGFWTRDAAATGTRQLRPA